MIMLCTIEIPKIRTSSAHNFVKLRSKVKYKNILGYLQQPLHREIKKY